MAIEALRGKDKVNAVAVLWPFLTRIQANWQDDHPRNVGNGAKGRARDERDEDDDSDSESGGDDDDSEEGSGDDDDDDDDEEESSDDDSEEGDEVIEFNWSNEVAEAGGAQQLEELSCGCAWNFRAPARREAAGAFSSEIFPHFAGFGVFPLLSTLNHDCAPNCDTAFIQDRGVAVLALRDIRAGEELSISYVNEGLPVADRRRQLLAYGFECACERCADEAEQADATCESDAKRRRVDAPHS